MTRGEPDLLDLIEDPRAEFVHICLPSMGYVCGGSIVGLADGGPGGHQVLGEEHWSQVTCRECLAPGRREVAQIQHQQQKPDSHVCTDECPWTQIPEEAA